MKIQDNKPLKIAIVGKGGTGKTAITTIMAKILSKDYSLKMLLIDADPTHPHLCQMVNLMPPKTLETMRLEAVKEAHQKDTNATKLAERIDFKVYDTLAESKDFCLFSIGQPEGPGCFCPSNTLLRKVIESISRDFDLILMDCEAGLEQINRAVLKSIDLIIIISDISLRSIQTASSIKKHAKKFSHYKEIGLIINRVKGDIGIVKDKLKELDIPLYGEVPEDPKIMEYDLQGRPIIELPDDAPSVYALRIILKNILEY